MAWGFAEIYECELKEIEQEILMFLFNSAQSS